MKGQGRRNPAGAKVVELRRPHDTRDRVLAVAQILFAERGFRGTSLRDIARRIGIQAPSLLHHFPSKQQLYLAVLDRVFEGMEEAAAAVLIGRESFQDRMRKAISGAIDYIARRPDAVRILWQEMSDETGVGRQLLKRRIPPLNSMALNFIFSGQRAGEFRSEVDPFHFLMSLNSITLAYFTTAAMVRRLWNINMLEPQLIEKRKREVIDMVERTLFVTPPPGSGQDAPAT
jgi:TetR/AcrR family transcriptional regulator